jgi:glycosyltransferase involved in cell wall biosynthesis
MTDPLGQSQVLSYMEKLAAFYDITIISCEKKARFKKYGKDVRNICSQTGINWQPLFYTKSPPVLSTIYDVWKIWKRSKALFRKQAFDIIHCRSYVASLAGLKLKKKYGARFIFDMRGFWIDEKIEGGYWKEESWLYKPVIKYLRKKENAFYGESDKIVSLTTAAKEVIIKARKAAAEKIDIIPTCVNLEVFKPFNASVRKRVREELGISPDNFVLLYSGGYGANYDIGFVKEVFRKLKEKNPATCILILSKDGVTGLENDASATELFTVSLPYAKVSDYLMAGDLGIINYVNRFSVAGRSPTKLAEYWASGMPAISPQGVGDVDYLFSTYKQSGIIYNDKKDIEEQLKTVMGVDKGLLRSYAVDYFSLENGVKKYKAIYEGLMLRNNKE